MQEECLDIMADEMEQGEIVSDSGSDRAVPVPQENLVEMIRGLKHPRRNCNKILQSYRP